MRVAGKYFTGGLDVFVFTPTISATVVYNYSVYDAAITAGWDGVKALYATISLTAGASIQSASANEAFTSNITAAGSDIRLNIASGCAVQGRSGAGGAGGGISSQVQNGSAGGTGGRAIVVNTGVGLKIDNQGSIIGGGGGGGGGGNGIANTGGPPLLGGGGTGGGAGVSATAGTSDTFNGRTASGGSGGNEGSSGGNGSSSDGNVCGVGGPPGAQGDAVFGIANVTYINRGTISGAEV